MRKKTQLVAAFAAEPDFLILDEPRNGLDPVGIVHMHEAVDNLRARGSCALVATHDLDWALARAQRIIGLCRGGVAVDEITARLHPGGEHELVRRLT